MERWSTRPRPDSLSDVVPERVTSALPVHWWCSLKQGSLDDALCRQPSPQSISESPNSRRDDLLPDRSGEIDAVHPFVRRTLGLFAKLPRSIESIHSRFLRSRRCIRLAERLLRDGRVGRRCILGRRRECETGKSPNHILLRIHRRIGELRCHVLHIVLECRVAALTSSQATFFGSRSDGGLLQTMAVRPPSIRLTLSHPATLSMTFVSASWHSSSLKKQNCDWLTQQLTSAMMFRVCASTDDRVRRLKGSQLCACCELPPMIVWGVMFQVGSSADLEWCHMPFRS